MQQGVKWTESPVEGFKYSICNHGPLVTKSPCCFTMFVAEDRKAGESMAADLTAAGGLVGLEKPICAENLDI